MMTDVKHGQSWKQPEVIVCNEGVDLVLTLVGTFFYYILKDEFPIFQVCVKPAVRCP